MTRQAYAAALIDLDGTLIGRDEKVSPRVAQAAARLAALIPVSISSGREPADVLRFAAELGLHAPQVSDNGAVVLDPATGETLHTFSMPAAQAEQVVRYLDARRVPFIATHALGTFSALSQIPDWDLARVSALDLDQAGADVIAGAFAHDPEMHIDRAWLPYKTRPTRSRPWQTASSLRWTRTAWPWPSKRSSFPAHCVERPLLRTSSPLTGLSTTVIPA